MTDLIDRQKIAKRHSNAGNTGSTKSLIEAASRFRYQNTGGTSSFSSSDGIMYRLKNKIKPRRRKNVSASGKSRQHVKKRSVSPGKSGPGFAVEAGKFFSNLRKKFSGINTKAILITGASAAAAAAAAFFIISYIHELRMFDGLALYQEAAIEDVLYDSLPADYSGQGSGELSGIEPVLLSSGDPISYTVKAGDTLSEISKNHNVKIGTLISFNKITDVRRLQVGTELKIPGYDGIPYEVKAGDSIASIAKKNNTTVNSILDANNLESDVLKPGETLFIPGASMNEFDYKKAMGTLFIYPTAGRFSSGFGYRPDPFTGKTRFHNGIDLANQTGTRVVATMSGLVVDIGDQPTGYGKYVIIKHSNGYQSLYGHLNRVTVRKGEYIYQNEKVGEMGNTGRSTGPHLHFSIYKNNTPVNPMTYLW